jgi:hypothetical protein
VWGVGWLSFDPDTTCFRSGKKAIELTPSEWPSSVCSAAPVRLRWTPHAGGHHIICRLEFNDGGELWLVRIPIIPASSTSNNTQIRKWQIAKRQFTIESKIEIMKCFANFTNIPIPKIFGHIMSINRNPIKLPYILMKCIRGNMLFDLETSGILITEQKYKVRKSIALIQVYAKSCHYFPLTHFF